MNQLISNVVDSWAERIVLRALEQVRHGRIVVEWAGRRRTFGSDGHAVLLRVHHQRFFRRVLTGGELALGESYMDGDWSTPDLVSLVRMMLALSLIHISEPTRPY